VTIDRQVYIRRQYRPRSFGGPGLVEKAVRDYSREDRLWAFPGIGDVIAPWSGDQP
jgi:hypothetical protein